MSSEDALAAITFDRQFTDELILVPFTILCFDHLLTLEDEINFVWKKPKRPSFFLFVVLRYVSLLSNIAMIMLRFGPAPLERCHGIAIAKRVLLIVQCVLVATILGLRIYVMYNLSKKVLLFLIAIGIVTVSLAAWSITGDTLSLATPTSGCEAATFKESAFRMAGAWEAQFFCDVVVFVFTVVRSYSQPVRIRGSLLSYMVRDGALYFAVFALVNLANILMFYLGDPWIASNLSWFTSTLSVTMTSRLMLHLHQVAALGVLTKHDAEAAVALVQSK